MCSVAMYTEWHFPYWGRGKGSHIGVLVVAAHGIRDPIPLMGFSIQSPPPQVDSNLKNTNHTLNEQKK